MASLRSLESIWAEIAGPYQEMRRAYAENAGGPPRGGQGLDFARPASTFPLSAVLRTALTHRRSNPAAPVRMSRRSGDEPLGRRGRPSLRAGDPTQNRCAPFLNDGVYGGLNELPVIGNLDRLDTNRKTSPQPQHFVPVEELTVDPHQAPPQRGGPTTPATLPGAQSRRGLSRCRAAWSPASHPDGGLGAAPHRARLTRTATPHPARRSRRSP